MRIILQNTLLLALCDRWYHIYYPWLFALCKKSFFLHQNASPLNLFLESEPLKSVANEILLALPKSRRGLQYIPVTLARLTELVQKVPLGHTGLMNRATAILEHWVYSCAPPMKLLSNNENSFNLNFFRVYDILSIFLVWSSLQSLLRKMSDWNNTARPRQPYCVSMWIIFSSNWLYSHLHPRTSSTAMCIVLLIIQTILCSIGGSLTYIAIYRVYW